jgi:8-oxo-dGTP diphosphatase
MGLELEGFELFSVKEFSDRLESTFWKPADLNIDDISLQEGQCLKWFTEQEAKATALAYGFNEIVADFYAKAPFLRR